MCILFIKISVCIKPWAAHSVLQGLTGDTDEFCAQGPQSQISGQLLGDSLKRAAPSAAQSAASLKRETPRIHVVSPSFKILTTNLKF